MTIFVILTLMMQTGPYRPYPDLIDYSKLPPDRFQTLREIDLAIGSLTSKGYEVSEADIVRALHDPMGRAAALSVLADAYWIKINLQTPGITNALHDAFNDAFLNNDEGAIPHLARVLAGTDRRDWVRDAVSILPQMKWRLDQIALANTLAWIGRAEGWPIVRTAIASNDPVQISKALNDIEKFDGLRNPDGGRPIDVAAELRQLASTTPDNLMIGPENCKTPVRGQIEAKAAQIERQRGTSKKQMK